jgi:hypothetical protein
MDKPVTTAKTRAAEALYPMLSAFHSIDDRPLKGVWKIYTDGSLDKLVLEFDTVSLIVVADGNDDSIDITATGTPDLRNTDGVDGSHLEPWKNFIGRPFGWGWITINQQGYCDGLLLSFGGIVPQLFLNVIASSIKVSTIKGSEDKSSNLGILLDSKAG